MRYFGTVGFGLLISCVHTKKTTEIEKPTAVFDGSYAKVPLEKEIVQLAIVQSDAKRIEDVAQAQTVLGENVEHMVDMGRQACDMDKKPDIILFHEFPITGYFYGDRDEKQHIAIEIPGPETKALGVLAKECDAYVVFGAYAKDAQWPGHIMSINTVIDRKGNIRKKVWKPRNIKRFYPTFEISTTTVESVQKRFRAMYGIDDEFPVIQTEFGNIAVSTAQLDPLVFNVFGIKGVEIMLRTSTLYFPSDIIHTAMVNNFYSAMANIPYDSPYGGRSLIVSPDGETLAQHESTTDEGIITAEIPIGEFRKNRRLPQYSVAFTQSVLSTYQDEIPPNHLDLPPEELPKNGKEMKVLLDAKSTWLNAEKAKEASTVSLVPALDFDKKIPWQPFSEEAIDELVDSNQAIFIDFTADWCASCKMVNEKTILETEAVRAAMKKHNIWPMKADNTNYSPLIDRWLKHFKSPGVPLYLVIPAKRKAGFDNYAADVINLGEFITTSKVISALEKASAK